MKAKVQEKTTLLAALKSLSPDSSNNTLKEWVKQGRVLVDGQAPNSWQVMPGEEVAVGPRRAFAEEGIKILYEDRYLVVIEKPKGLLSVASLLEHELTAQAILSRRQKRKAFAVHRLDQDTSGVMMFAYTPEAQEKLKEQFAAHSIERVYLGLVKGHPNPAKGTWRSYLEEDDFYFVKSGTAGKLAITHYEVIEKKGLNSLVKFTLQTGKKNQIRVHASEAGHAIIGDKKYGYSGGPLCLHAHVLGFYHPFRKKVMRFVSEKV
jgi:tRNA pseudouridine32 synthase/23S rRNA pseudouridine746 synthase/23S rRNA pseudouridine1911/1915/1917 synthase